MTLLINKMTLLGATLLGAIYLKFSNIKVHNMTKCIAKVSCPVCTVCTVYIVFVALNVIGNFRY